MQEFLSNNGMYLVAGMIISVLDIIFARVIYFGFIKIAEDKHISSLKIFTNNLYADKTVF